jgi:hypothetical protein
MDVINGQKETLLMQAAFHNDDECAEEIIKAGRKQMNEEQLK